MRNNLFFNKNLSFYILISIASILVLCSCISFLPFVQEAIINLVEENYLHRELRKPFLWAGRIHSVVCLITFIPLFFIYLNHTKYGGENKTYVKTISCEFMQKFSTKKLEILFVALLLFLTFFSLISNDIRFQDDMGRTINGSRDWARVDSRFISEILSTFLHTNFVLPDVGPFLQILSIVYSLFVIFLTAYIFDKELHLFSVIAASLLFVGLFFAGNISYQFDAFYMTLSVSFAVFPFLFRDDKKTFYFATVIFLLCTCMTYQASTSIYIIITLALFWKDWLKKGKQNYQFLFSSVIGFCITLLAFRFLFMFPIEYEANAYYQTRIPALPHFIPTFCTNIISYIKTTFYLFGNAYCKFFFIANALMFVINSTAFSQRSKIITLPLSVAFFFVMYALSFGVFLAFELPLLHPRAFTGFNSLLACLCLFNIQASHKRTKTLSKIFLVLLLYGNVVFYNVYASAMKVQKKYEEFRCALLLNDINDDAHINLHKPYKLYVDGTGGISPLLESELKQYPIIRTLLSDTFNTIWREDILLQYNFYVEDDKETPDIHNMQLLKDAAYHTIYINDDNIYIIMK